MLKPKLEYITKDSREDHGLSLRFGLIPIVILILGIASCDWSAAVNQEDDIAEVNSMTVEERDKTIDELNESIRNSPNNPELYEKRGILLLESAKYAPALDDMERAMRLDSSRASVHYNIGRIYYRSEMIGQAKYAFQRAIELDGQYTDPKLELAELYLLLTNHNRAMTQINDALRVDDQLAKGYFLKGLIYKEKNNIELAKSSLQTVVELEPDFAEAFNLLGMMYGAEQNEIALVYYDSGLEADSMNREILYNKAYFLQDQLKPSEALKAYDELIRKHPNTAVAYHNQGYILLGLLSSPAEAIDKFTEAIRIDPKYAQAYANRGVALEQLGRYQQAVNDYKKAIDISGSMDIATKGLNRLEAYLN